MGDIGRNHLVFAAVDNHQPEHEGTLVEATCTLCDISASTIFDSSALDYFISPSLVQQFGIVEVH